MTGSSMTFEHAYNEYHRPVLAHISRLISDRDTAEDLCQETFMKAFRAWEKRDQQAALGAWLYRIATNTAYDHLRRRRRIRFTTLEDSENNSVFAYHDDQRMVEQEPVQMALAQIPEMYRQPLMMHSCGGHSTQEIADSLGCSLSAVKTRLFRARARFRQVYQG